MDAVKAAEVKPRLTARGVENTAVQQTGIAADVFKNTGRRYRAIRTAD